MIKSKEKGIIYLFLLAFFIVLTYCTDRKNNQKSLSIQKFADIRFRRSYANLQFDSTLNTDSIQKSNPELYSNVDTPIIHRLLELSIVDTHYGLIRSRFSDTVQLSFPLSYNDSIISCSFQRPPDPGEYGLYDLVVMNGHNKKSIRLEGRYGAMNRDISYLLLDIIPGGFKEIVVLNDYYIMLGDNSDIYIYEIKYEKQ